MKIKKAPIIIKDEITYSGKKHKYQARKYRIDGHVFDSLPEFQEYGDLKYRLEAGELEELQVHPRFELKVNNKVVGSHKPDFLYRERDSIRTTIKEIKGALTKKDNAWIFRSKVFQACYPEFDYVVTERKAKRRK